jgi:hypothetical protein
MKLPYPNERLAGCVWLPRILEKARLFRAGGLEADYAARFCHPQGVDGFFIAHFGLSREDILSAAALSDARAEEWFLNRTTPDQIERWNLTALNLGRPGFPMAERLQIALSTTYKNVKDRGLTTVFEILEADES